MIIKVLSGSVHNLFEDISTSFNNQTVYLFSAPSGSGKSYLAKRLLEVFPKKIVRVNKDSLRKMAFHKWFGKGENLINSAEIAIVREALRQGFSVIIDDTNLTPKHVNMWETIISCIDNISFIHVNIESSLEDCIKKDSSRIGKERVFRPIIEKQFLLAKKVDWGVRPVLIVDIDGTIADSTWRLKKRRLNYNEWQQSCSEDLPIVKNLEHVKKMAITHTIIIVTGRSVEIANKTISWLMYHQVKFNHFYMRNKNDYRTNKLVKKEILDLIISSGLSVNQVEYAMEDDLEIQELYLSYGIPIKDFK